MAEIFFSLIIVIGLILQFFLFFKSTKMAFSVFLGVAFIQILAVGTFWFDSYRSYRILDRLVQPIVSQFNAPQTIAEGLILQNITWKGRSLTHTYLASTRENVPSWDIVRALSCRGSTRVNLLALGAVLEHTYLVEDTQVSSYRISLRTCFSND